MVAEEARTEATRLAQPLVVQVVVVVVVAAAVEVVAAVVASLVLAAAVARQEAEELDVAAEEEVGRATRLVDSLEAAVAAGMAASHGNPCAKSAQRVAADTSPMGARAPTRRRRTQRRLPEPQLASVANWMANGRRLLLWASCATNEMCRVR